MSQLDPSQSPEERIQQAMAQGPNVEAAGRFGPITRYARKLLGRAVKYERDFNMQVDLALLDRLHEVENELRVAETRLASTDDNLRYADNVLREAHQRTRQDVEVLLSRVSTLETSNADLHSRVRDADKRAAVANSIASGAADGLLELNRTAVEVDVRVRRDDRAALPRGRGHAALHRQGWSRRASDIAAGPVPRRCTPASRTSSAERSTSSGIASACTST